MIWISLLAVVIILFGCAALVWHKKSLPKLSAKDLKIVDKKIKGLGTHDATSFVIQLHTLWHHSLKNLLKDSTLTAFEALKVVEDRLPNKEAIWKFHKLRNKAAHEIGMKLNDKEISTLKREVKKALKALSK